MTGHDHDLVTCHGRAISERQLKEVCLRALNKIIEPNKVFRAKLQNNIRHAISQVNEEQATKLDRELDPPTNSFNQPDTPLQGLRQN